MSSRFEFLGSTSLGQYIPRDSWFHTRDPRARLISFVIIFVAVIFTPNTWGLLLGIFFITSLYFLAHLPIKSTWAGIRRALPFIIILAILQIIFFRTAENMTYHWKIFGIGISQEALFSALNLILRFLVLIIVLNAFVMSLSTSQVTAALFHLLKPFDRIGLPVNDLTMVIQIAMRYLPLIAQIAEKTAKAQAARGADWEQKGFNPIKQAKRVLPLIVPLIVNSLKRAETMAVAMESRGFNAGQKRSSFHNLVYTWEDGLLILTTLLLSSLMLFSSYIF
ncbi:MAG: energy-coupling factor transporter transmembrane component T [Chloroflexota bacterium]|nr:energy-coupling factor transporter transmembrane component T [Chloroflexota bacterium]